MKKNKRLFCELMATGLYEGFSAVEAVYGDKYESSNDKAVSLLADKQVVSRIKQLKLSNDTMSNVDAVWIKNTLIKLIDKSQRLDDSATVRYALDMINKMDGNYLPENMNAQDVSLTMHF